MANKRTKTDIKKLACDDVFHVKRQAGDSVIVEGLANKFSVDRGDEIISTDAWDLENFKKNPVILFNHGMDSLGGTPVGKATEVRPTDDGLYIKVRMSNSKAPMIQMVRDLVEERILKAFSVGFDPKETENVDIEGKSVRKITKAELYEVSIVGIPMNQDSLFELSEKALTTKSLHEIKSDFLKAKGASKALEIEAKFVDGQDRKQIIGQVAKSLNLAEIEVKDMLAGDKDIPDHVISAFNKQMGEGDDMEKEEEKTIEQMVAEAAEKIAKGADEKEVLEELGTYIKEKISEEKGSYEDEKPKEKASEEEGEREEEASEEEGEREEEEKGDYSSEDEEKRDREGQKGSDEHDGQEKVRKDFQECVSSKIPILLDEGKDRDQAVAQAIAMCQQEGKCTLAAESKLSVFKTCFDAIEQEKFALELPSDIKFEQNVNEKQIDEESQKEDQAPTQPIDTDVKNDDFGSPYLEAAKQTNVLLGTLINEMQKLTAQIAQMQPARMGEEDDENSVDQPKDSENSTETSEEKAISVDYAEKKLENLNQRLKSLGY